MLSPISCESVLWPNLCISHSLHLAQSDVSAGAMFGLNKREQWPSGCAKNDWHRQEMHVRSLVAVRAFVSVAKVVVLCVCSGCEGQGTTQYPLEVD
jgi:hypothetical protein